MSNPPLKLKDAHVRFPEGTICVRHFHPNLRVGTDAFTVMAVIYQMMYERGKKEQENEEVSVLRR